MPAIWVLWLASYFRCTPGEVLLALATFLLVGATVLLVWVTVWSVKVVRKQRKAAMRPVVVVRSDGVKAGMVNVGSGIALNVCAWILNDAGTLLSRQCAEAIWIRETHWPQSWQQKTEGFGRDRSFWIRYVDSEGDQYYSYRAANRKWQTGKGTGPKLPRDNIAADKVVGVWEKPQG